MKRRHALLLMALVLVALAGCGGTSWSSGDRVLVAKYVYDSHLESPERYQVVVFKYPRAPLKKQVPTNYIKRLLGLPGELLAIFFGRIYRCDEEPSQKLRQQLSELARSEAKDPLDLWEQKYMYSDDSDAVALFTQRKYKILHKPPATMLAMRRLVYDNDHQPRDLKGVLPPRWTPDREGDTSWQTDGPTGFRNSGKAGAEIAWLRYQHILRPEDWGAGGRKHLEEADKKPQLIRDFSGYNSYETPKRPHAPQSNNWVGDLMLECDLTVERAEGELWMELGRGVNRFQARWNLQNGECALFRPGSGNTPLAKAKTTINHPGTFVVRLANFDDRLTVWVDRALPFDVGVEYDPAGPPGPTADDLRPALIGCKGAAVKIDHLRLWRATYYTTGREGGPGAPDAEGVGNHDNPEFWSDPGRWQSLRALKPLTIFVQPGHYLCLGDNSPESSDSRDWGTVPERLLLGRALVVYWPVGRLGTIH